MRKRNNRRSSKGNSRNSSKNTPKITNKITEHFHKKDFMCPCGECSKKLKLSLGLIGGLELLRSKLKKKITIVKGYECAESAEKNKRIKRNFHLIGVAAIITAENTSTEDLFLAAEAIPEFKGLGLNFDDNTVYVDTRKEDERKTWVVKNKEEILIADENRAQYLAPETPQTENA